MAFCEFENENDAQAVYASKNSWEIGGRWLQLDELKPRGGETETPKKRNFAGKPVSAAAKNKGYIDSAGYTGNKISFDD